MTNRTYRLLAGLTSVAVALGTVPLTATQAIAAPSYPLTVDYHVDAGAMEHVGGGNLHPFDERSPAQWLTDGISINAVRGMDHSRRQSPYHEYLPGWFEEPTHDRLMKINPDAKLMIGTYYGFKGKVARGEYDNGNTDWQGLAQKDGGAAYKEYIAGELADARTRGIDVHSWVLWNEPDIQWSSQSAYFQGFKNGYDGVKSFDPTQRVQGPEVSSFKFSYLTAFLTYCKQNNCLPDILTWHELSSTRTAIEDHAKQITQWMQQNDIPVVPIAITEYQGTGYSTTESGRRSQGNYNPGLSVSYLGEFERASETTSLDFGLRSAWGLPGGNPNARGFLGEMATFDDAGKMATGIWYVYNAYWDMTGHKVGTTFDKTKIDAVATYDRNAKANQSGILLGNWEETTKTVPVTLENLPKALVIGGRVHVQAELIEETLATANYGTVPVISQNVAATRGKASFSLDIPGRTAARIFVTTPSRDPILYSAVAGSATKPVDASTTGTVRTSMESLGGTAYSAHTGGTPGSYRDAAGAETAVESGDSVTYRFCVRKSGIHNLRTRFVSTSSGAFIQPYVDGKSTGSPVDLYSAQPRFVSHDHGQIYLSKGSHEITYRIVGAGKNTASSGYDINIQHLAVAAEQTPST